VKESNGQTRINGLTAKSSQHCAGHTNCNTSVYGNRQTRRVGDVINVHDENEPSSLRRDGSACNLCEGSPSRRPLASRRSYLSAVGISRDGSTECTQSSFPLLDLRPTMTSLSPTLRSMRWRDTIAARPGDFDSPSSLSQFHSPDGSTGRTVSRSSNRLLDFDDETIVSTGENDEDNRSDVVDLLEDVEQVVTKAASCSRPVTNCSLYDDGDLISRTSGGIISTNVPPPPSPCTINSVESSSSHLSSSSTTGRYQSKRTSSRRSKAYDTTSARSRPRLRCRRDVTWLPCSDHEDRSDEDRRRNTVVDSSSSGLGLGIRTENKRCSRHQHTHNYRSKNRLPRSASKDFRRNQPDSPNRLVYSDQECLPQASHASITDCPPPSPSSDYFRLNLWAGEPPDGADGDDDVDSVDEKPSVCDLVDSGDDRRSPFTFRARWSNIWHTQVNEVSANVNKLDTHNVS